MNQGKGTENFKSNSLVRILTIGVYGFTKESFFATLTNSKVDTFCDIRSRRGVRGSKYAFANSLRLQDQLSLLGIRYLHLKELGPSQFVRDTQKDDDLNKNISKRDRTVLSSGFIKAYETECMQDFDTANFLNDIGAEAQVVALCCVEREPLACHRSIVANRLQCELGIELEHLLP